MGGFADLLSLIGVWLGGKKITAPTVSKFPRIDNVILKEYITQDIKFKEYSVFENIIIRDYIFKDITIQNS